MMATHYQATKGGPEIFSGRPYREKHLTDRNGNLKYPHVKSPRTSSHQTHSTRQQAMNPTTIAILLIVIPICASCSNEQLQKQMDERNERYEKLNERQEIRADARRKRDDMWFEKHMN
jgi:hypothetical protein